MIPKRQDVITKLFNSDIVPRNKAIIAVAEIINKATAFPLDITEIVKDLSSHIYSGIINMLKEQGWRVNVNQEAGTITIE